LISAIELWFVCGLVLEIDEQKYVFSSFIDLKLCLFLTSGLRENSFRLIVDRRVLLNRTCEKELLEPTNLPNLLLFLCFPQHLTSVSLNAWRNLSDIIEYNTRINK
jgi:hypothetical protein